MARCQPTGVVIVHFERGSQCRARTFRAVLNATGLQASIGRIASAGDIVAMESWHALLQNNVLDRRRWRTRDQLHEEIVVWIEHTDNRRRRQRGPSNSPLSNTSSRSPLKTPQSRHDQSQPLSTELVAVPYLD